MIIENIKMHWKERQRKKQEKEYQDRQKLIAELQQMLDDKRKELKEQGKIPVTEEEN